VWFELGVELIKHDTRLHRDATILDVEIDNSVEILRRINDEGFVDRLSALGCAAASRRYADADISRNRQRRAHVVVGFRNDNAKWHHLIDRRVGGIATAREMIKQNVATGIAAKTICQRGFAGIGGGVK